MTDLVAVVSSGAGTAKHVERVAFEMNWGKVMLVVPVASEAPFPLRANMELVKVDFSQPMGAVVENLVTHLKPKISGTEVGLNMISGDGKEHMAVLSAVLKCGVGFRLIALTKDGVTEI
ncbi:MAG: hypothetical protein AABX47_10315 [Nanoarchaeota archaeon]